MENVVQLLHHYFPWELEREIAKFIEYYNHERYHESLNNVKPGDGYERRGQQILERREQIERRPLQLRRQRNLGSAKCIPLFKTQVAYIALTMYHHTFTHILWQGLEQA